MSLIREQSAFLLHVSELIKKASELGFFISGGELFRTPEQQALHVQNGRSATLNSQHLKRLAIDLNFFKELPNGELKLTYDIDELRPLGLFWEGLDDANRWGGNWTSFKDAPHFERKENGKLNTNPLVNAVATTLVQARTAPNPSPIRGAGLISATVGENKPNTRDDVETLQRLLNIAITQQVFPITLPLKADGAFGTKTLTAIIEFQRSVLGELTPTGSVEPNSKTLFSLTKLLPNTLEATIFELLFLRAAETAIQDLSTDIVKVLASRNIDTPLRQSHFLAQIGHESGELRFRAEIANGQAYEGRQDLGNTNPGDGQKFKGRGLIQLTGRANYAEYGRALGRENELLNHPELVETETQLTIDVAGWFWAKRGLNNFADADDLTTITKKINGGLNGLEDRRRLLKRAKALLIT